MTGEEYMAVLEERRAAHAAEHGERAGFPALLEWFIRPGDEDLVTLPEVALKRESRPRTYRTAASLTTERDGVAQAIQALSDSATLPDRAAAHGEALGPRRTARHAAKGDRALAKAGTLRDRLGALNMRIARAQRREATP